MLFKIKNVLKLIRPHQYIKNLFIFLPLFFIGQITNSELLTNALIAFISFSISASAVYILNDYIDIEEDRQHPRKKDRPLASGLISKKEAFSLIAIFSIMGIALMATQSLKAFHKKGAGQTLEYAYQDWTLAQLAKALGDNKDYEYFNNRSNNYKYLFNSQTGYIHPKQANGNWLEDYTPGDYVKGFVESNGYQGTWYVPHDYEGLATLMGGTDSLIYKLNSNFEQASKQGFTAGKKHADEELKDYKRTPINYGNQPSIHTAFIFSAVGAPWLTQKWSRAVVDSVYSGLSPNYGYNGDEDQGLMGSLAVLMKIGLFQVNGGTEIDPAYQIGSPIFDKVEIDLSSEYYSGKTFTIETVNNSKDNVYIK